MNFALTEFTIRRQEKGCDSGALKALVGYNSREKDVMTMTVHGGWRKEAERDSGAISVLALKGGGMKRCSKGGWGWGERYIPETGRSCIKHREANSRGCLGNCRGFGNSEARDKADVWE